ncbi:MAG: hypothetical protein KZQ83_01270 [gamma proteobacterium symbiont of Taylorina sp.]|nr:hypothetical protein [gamma proteobacterium symbiont of Taylorina sp.]
MINILIIFIIILLTACQSTSIKTEDSYFQAIPDATIEITRQLSVPANSARAFFQNGELLSHTAINLYNINCEVRINTVSESKQIIEPGVFDVVSIIQDESPIVMRKTMMLASLDLSSWHYAFGGGRGSPVNIKRFYRFKLSPQDASEQTTQVRSLTCRGAEDEPFLAELPTLNEMKEAAGSYIIFNL